MGTFLRPHIFISYSRADGEFVTPLTRDLTDRGFSVFFDKVGVHAGDDFVRRILTELRRADAVVALLSASSATSPWCQAELYHAHALGLPIIPIRIGKEPVSLPAPLEMMQRTVQFLRAEDKTSFRELSTEFTARLQAVRRRRLRRQSGKLSLFVLLGLLLVAGSGLAVRQVNVLNERKERESLIQQIKDSVLPSPAPTIQVWAGRFAGDRELLNTMSRMSQDSTLPDTVRLNALLLANALGSRHQIQDRWFLKDLNWRNSQLRRAKLVDVTFSTGIIEDVSFDRSTFAGVVWNSAGTEGRGGLTLANLRFSNSDFYFTWFAGTNAVSLEFVNSNFKGSVLDVSNFGHVRFVSRSSAPENSNLITGEVASFENSIVLNRRQPPELGVLDLGEPTDEVLFDGVVFEAVHFRGWIRPEWFRNCHFRYCVFPTSLRESDLAAQNASIHGSIWQDEDFD